MATLRDIFSLLFPSVTVRVFCFHSFLGCGRNAGRTGFDAAQPCRHDGVAGRKEVADLLQQEKGEPSRHAPLPSTVRGRFLFRRHRLPAQDSKEKRSRRGAPFRNRCP